MGEQGGERKTEIEKAGDVVGVLAVCGEANLTGDNRLRGAEIGQGERGEDPRAGDVSAQKRAQVARGLGEFPDQPYDHHFLKIGADSIRSLRRIDGPETGAAKPEKKDQHQPLEGAGRAPTAGLEYGGNGDEKQRQTHDARHIAERRPEVERKLPRNREGESDEEGPGEAAHRLGPVNTTWDGGDGSRYCPDREVRSDAYRASASDERRRDGQNWPRPFGLRRKCAHTLLSSSPWNHQSLPPPPRLSAFSRATPSTPGCVHRP